MRRRHCYEFHAYAASRAGLKNVQQPSSERQLTLVVAMGAKEARGQKLVNVAEFDLAAERTVDAIRAQNGLKGRKRSAPIADKALAPPMGDGENEFSPILAHEQARRVAYMADLAKLRRDEKLGTLLPTEKIAEAAAQCAEALNRIIDQLPGRADEIASAVAKDGESGVRNFLRSVVRDMRERLADEMQRLATMSGEAPGGK
jgi:hypothetical protein